MSNSVALVAITRVTSFIRHELSISDILIDELASSKKISKEEAREKVIQISARVALKLTQNDEKAAKTALVIVNGRVNRLPQCTKLLRKHREEVVRLAYSLKDDLVVADTSLRILCRFLEHTDLDLEGEASQLRGLLEDIAMHASSEKQQWYLYHRIEEMFNDGHMLETIGDEIRQRIQFPFHPIMCENWGAENESD